MYSLGEYLTVTTVSDAAYNLRFAINKKQNTESIRKSINELIAQRIDDTNDIINAINNQHK